MTGVQTCALPISVAADVADEKVSVVAARDLYGVALTAAGTVDDDGTAALRAGRNGG